MTKEPYWLIKLNDKYWSNTDPAVWTKKSKAFKFHYKYIALTNMKGFNLSGTKLVKISPPNTIPDIYYANFHDGCTLFYKSEKEAREEIGNATHTVAYISKSKHDELMSEAINSIKDRLLEIDSGFMDILGCVENNRTIIDDIFRNLSLKEDKL